MCSFGSCKMRFEFLNQFRKIRNAFECFVTQVQTRLAKTKRVWPMKINVICMYGMTHLTGRIATNIEITLFQRKGQFANDSHSSNLRSMFIDRVTPALKFQISYLSSFLPPPRFPDDNF